MLEDDERSYEGFLSMEEGLKYYPFSKNKMQGSHKEAFHPSEEDDENPPILILMVKIKEFLTKGIH